MTHSHEVLAKFLRAQDRLIFQSSDLSLGTIANMVNKGAIDIAPSYQRRERWGRDKQSALIESFLLNIPVPPVYLSEDEFGRYSVVDGKQRVTAIAAFMDNRLSLSNLEGYSEIEGATFEDLPQDLQNALDVRPYLRVVTILKQSDPLLKFEVFIRLNRGGESMNPQELRNVAYRGKFNDLIYNLAENEFLKAQMKIRDEKSSAYQTMSDAEMVLRFLALRANWQNFSGDYRQEMDKYMRVTQNIDESLINVLHMAFSDSINTCRDIWGDLSFKRPDGDTWRDQFLTGMYDAQMVAVDMLSAEQKTQASASADVIVDRTRQLFNDAAFDSAVRQGTNNSTKVRLRISSIFRILTENL